MRQKLYQLIEGGDSRYSKTYDVAMILIIVVSMLPLTQKEPSAFMQMLDFVCVAVFIVDYILRFILADYIVKKGTSSFLRYPFTPMAIIDLLAILPSITPMAGGFRLLKVIRLSRAFRVLRVFKLFRYSKSLIRVSNVIKAQRDSLIAVGILAIAYIIVSALLVFNIEPDTYDTFFDAFYWATVSLTTVGYGDIYPVSMAGKIVTMFSSMFGIAVVALPAGIITAGYMDELEKERNGEE